MLAATELARFGRRWLLTLGIAAVVFEVLVVLALRAHYTMEVFSGALTALYAAHLANAISSRLDARAARKHL